MTEEMQFHIQGLQLSVKILAAYIRERDGSAYDAKIGELLHEMQEKMAPTAQMHHVFSATVDNLMNKPKWL